MTPARTSLPTENAAFLETASGRQWRRIGARRRAGVATPLFYLRSRSSAGVGEYPDVARLAEWCERTGLGIIQLLPLNDVGFTFRPYDAESSFALEPMHAALGPLVEGRPALKEELRALKERFPAKLRYDTGVKRAKLALLRKIHDASDARDPEFARFRERNAAWLGPYALYRVLKEKNSGRSWQEWPDDERDFSRARASAAAYAAETAFHEWVQWRLFQQMSEAKSECARRGVLIMGDLPFLVSRDSADVWSNPGFFKLGHAAGAPPDLLFSQGQRWGMPPYDWQAIAADGYRYLADKLRYAENFYDLFRVDHFVGLFRVWTFPADSDAGRFDPEDERQWEEHGKRILESMLGATDMLPCAEDLGTVPDCSFRVLERFGVPGMDVQRWTKDWKAHEFKAPDRYRANSVATAATHDITPLRAWWEFEAGTVEGSVFDARAAASGLDPRWARERVIDAPGSAHGRVRWKPDLRDAHALAARLERPRHEVGGLAELFEATFDEREKFWRAVGLSGEPSRKAEPRFIEAALTALSVSPSIFVSHLLQDWLALGTSLDGVEDWEYRINFPGTTSDANWRITLPFTIEELDAAGVNEAVLRINKLGGRA